MDDATEPYAHNPWQRHHRRLAYDNAWISVHHDEVTRPDGEPGVYGVVHFKNRAVGVVPIDGDDRVALVGQYRYTIETYSWEIPEGGCAAGEDLGDAVRRELREESGLRAGALDALGRFYLSNSVSDEEAFAYVATDLTHGPAQPEGTEQIVVRWVPFDDALAMIDRGEITDSLTVIALLAVARRRAASRGTT